MTSQLLHEWLSYRLYAAALQGCLTAAVRHSDFCRYASLCRKIVAEDVERQMEAIQPHLRSGYLAGATYEPGPLTSGLPDWDLVYRAGRSAHSEFLQFRKRRIQAVLPGQGWEKEGTCLVVPDKSV